MLRHGCNPVHAPLPVDGCGSPGAGFEHPDERKATVPVHPGRDIPRGLLRQVVTIDLGMDINEFMDML